jgi:hypothetical protein
MDMKESLGDLVNNLNKNMPVCDAKCQATGKKEKLMNEYNKAKYNAKNAKKTLLNIEQKYYTETSQTTYYNSLLYNRAKKHITNKMGEVEKYYNKLFEKILGLADTIGSQNMYRTNLNEVEDAYKYKLKVLKNKVNKTENKKQINNRLTFFYNQKSESWGTWFNGYIWYIYIFAIILLLIKFILKNQWKNPFRYPFLLLLIFSSYIIHFVYENILVGLGHLKLDITLLVFTASVSMLFYIYNKTHQLSMK